MHLLSWHGTLLRVARGQPRLTHAPPFPARTTGHDYDTGLVADGLSLPADLGAGITLVAGAAPPVVHVRRGEFLLSAAPDTPFPDFTAAAPAEAENFVLLTTAQLAALRVLLAGAFEGSETRPPFSLAPGFRLLCGAQSLALTEARPSIEDDGAILVPFSDEALRLRPVRPREAYAERRLARATGPAPVEVASAEALRAEPNSALTEPGVDEWYLPPLTGALADRTWLMTRAWPKAPQYGQLRHTMRFTHHQDVTVLLLRGLEGMVLDATGVRSDTGYLDQFFAPYPAGAAREGADVFVAGSVLADAPLLEGPHALFCSPYWGDHFHWLIDSMVPLCRLAPLLPPETTLLLPAALREAAAPGVPDKLAVLAALGFGDMPMVFFEAPAVRVASLFRPARAALFDMPAAVLDAARRRAVSRLPPAPHAGRKILLRPAAAPGIANFDRVEELTAGLGLETLSLAAMPFADQVDLFRNCALVVGVHGPDLANILFCPPGTGVLELAPDAVHRQHVNRLAGKLGLVPAILPCPTERNRPDGDLRVNMFRLRAILDILRLRARPAAAA